VPEIGQTISHYKIIEKLGQGGMGEVYLAKDTRLNRSVAIKVLPAHVSADPERRARFAREAKTIGGLNHPHICTLHDVGEHDGITYLVMEHLTGKTLAERLENGPLPLEQALEAGAQIAEALSAAHRQGIIHRDLKPSNVMFTKASPGAQHVKLLDFGLAKLKAHGEQPAAAFASATTRTAPVTSEGAIVGTLPYMAPEQVEGREADARTDLWALGAVLYEMVTGKRPFEGSSAASLIGNIMSAEPPAMTTRQPLTPPTLNRLVRRCLAKDPEARWQAASDVADELRWIAAERGQGVESGDHRMAAAPRAGRRPRAALMFAGALIAVALASVALTLYLAGDLAPSNGGLQYRLIDARPADHLQGVSTTRNRPSRTILALTPDGRRLLFVGNSGTHQQLYVRSFDAPEAKPLPGTEGAGMLFLSPDGQWVGFWTRNWLKKVPLEGGGPPVDIAQVPGAQVPFGASWGDDGTIVFSRLQNSGLWRVSDQGGRPELLIEPKPGEYTYRLPHMLPGSRAVLFTVLKEVGNWDTAGVAVHRFGTPGCEMLLAGAADARYVSTGHLIYFRRGQLMARPFDLEKLAFTGTERGLLANVMQATNSEISTYDSGAAQVAVSGTGTLAFVEGGEFPDENGRLVWVDRRGNVEPMTVDAKSYRWPRLSPDGWQISVHTAQSQLRVWVHDTRIAKSLIPVTNPEITARAALWTRDGSRLVFRAAPDGRRGLFWARPDGTEQPQLLISTEGGPQPASWTLDGQLVFLSQDAKTGFDLRLLTLEGEVWHDRPLLTEAYRESDGQVSPNGRWLAYTSDETERPEVYVREFPSLQNRRPVSTDGGINPVWSREGRELFYLRGTSPESQELVARDVSPDGAIGPVVKTLFRLAPLRLLRGTALPGFDVHPDGRRFVFVQSPEITPSPAPTVIHLVENWFEELKRLVPTGEK
jgi:eukaryotic-like serine/threonine-protein kinase